MPAGQFLIYKEEVFQVVGAAMEVHKSLGCGFLEPVYQEAFELELSNRGIPFKPQVELKICYKGNPLRKSYLADLTAFDKIIVELKAIDQLTSHEEAQVLNYLKATGFQVGLLLNFGAKSLEWKRLVLTDLGTRNRHQPQLNP